jgi:hypothetical protein
MARNPDYMTLEEAAEKLCPFKATSDIDKISGHCVSRECMAWRWHTYQVPIPENERTGPNIWKSEKEISMTYGRCGMVPL